MLNLPPTVGAVRVNAKQLEIYNELLQRARAASDMLNAFVAGVFSSNEIDEYKGVELTRGADGQHYLVYERVAPTLVEDRPTADIEETVTGSRDG